ncbi:MAG: ABC transporter ATP-binding protein [Chloroflexi bacterium 13_1_40CM_4_68_4]|nr:MAG: ABC transporter ATP-binding protein [Chloroflexi bacterium 13_1_40CM_4_68_4]
MATIIEVRDLTKRYRGASTNAVDAVSFSVESGQFFALLGPNGAGKTTTISMLTTTLAPTSGSAQIAGHDLVRDAAGVRGDVGIIFQRPSLDQNLTGEENVRLHVLLYGLYKWRPSYSFMPAEYRAALHDMAQLLGIGESIFKPIRTYSSGMRRKLEIVRALLHRPRVLFLDEPTAGLDVPTRRMLWDHLTRVRRESGTTIFLTTHYIEEAETADSICIIDHGKIVSFGTPDEVKANLVQHYVDVDAADRAALCDELARLGVRYVEGQHVRVELDGMSTHALLKSIDLPLDYIQTHSPTLEDAYLGIVSKGEP